jgi:2-oxoglutarate dehydrogenase E1 component
VATLKKIGNALTTLPEGFILHPNLKRLMQQKKQMFETGEGIDWATAEALAFGSLLLEKNHVRLSGQDVERGTFSHRHAVLHDQNSDSTYIPLNHIDAGQVIFRPALH